MLTYRLYLFDASGRIRERVEMECETDEHAMELAAQAEHPYAKEVWLDARRVGRFEPTGAAASRVQA
jgi:hypothetical protein